MLWALAMKIVVEVKPNSRKELVEELSAGKYRVRVNASPIDGKANEAVIGALAEFFDVPRTSVILIRGNKSKSKVFEIMTR